MQLNEIKIQNDMKVLLWTLPATHLSLLGGVTPLTVFLNHQQANLLNLPNFGEAMNSNF